MGRTSSPTLASTTKCSAPPPWWCVWTTPDQAPRCSAIGGSLTVTLWVSTVTSHPRRSELALVRAAPPRWRAACCSRACPPVAVAGSQQHGGPFLVHPAVQHIGGLRRAGPLSRPVALQDAPAWLTRRAAFPSEVAARRSTQARRSFDEARLIAASLLLAALAAARRLVTWSAAWTAPLPAQCPVKRHLIDADVRGLEDSPCGLWQEGGRSCADGVPSEWRRRRLRTRPGQARVSGARGLARVKRRDACAARGQRHGADLTGHGPACWTI